MWNKPPDKLSVNTGEVHLWQVDLLEPPRPLRYYMAIISEEEAARAARFYFEKDRHQFIVGRAVLRELLGRYLSLDPASIDFKFSDFGKPAFPNPAGIQFNISHSGGMALMGFTQTAEIGVDLEKIKPDLEIEQIASRFFAIKEKAALLQQPVHRQAASFYQCWTSKEAFIKAHGQGLSLPLDQFEVEVHPDKPAALKAVHWDPKLVENWDLYGFIPKEHFVGAVVCDRKIENVRFFTFG